jgi:hypothetical protein
VTGKTDSSGTRWFYGSVAAGEDGTVYFGTAQACRACAAPDRPIRPRRRCVFATSPSTRTSAETTNWRSNTPP